MKSKITLLNMISGLLLQVCMVISGFIIPNIILNYFGSEVNGLISSLSQFLSYISLIEGGLSGVLAASLYKPICEKDIEKISSILATGNKFYRKIGFIFIAYSLTIAIIYPIVFKINFSFVYLFSLTIILSLGLLIQYMFSITLKEFLFASKKGYIVSSIQIVIVLLNILLVFISIKIFPSIHILKLISSSLFLFQPVFYGKYVSKYYKIDKKAYIDNSLIKNRWNCFAVNFAVFVHKSTDVIILTMFTNLTTVSIYSVYTLVTNGLKQLIDSLTSGLNPTLGYSYAMHNADELNKKLDLYEYIILILVFFFFTVAGLLLTPFVMIYTSNIKDTSYFQPLFGILIILAEAISLIKYPQLTLSNVANKYKEITIPAFIEAGINIVFSVILVRKFGLIGVAIGTLVAMTYRLIFHIFFVKKIFKERNSKSYYLKILEFILPTLLMIFICFYILPPVRYEIFSWIWHAVLYSLILGITYIVISIMFFKKELKMIKKYLKNNL